MIFYITYSIWLLSEILLNRMRHSGKGDKQHADRQSISWLWLIFVGSVTAAIFISFRINLPMGNETLVPYIGLVMMWAGIMLRLWVIRQLGRMFTVDVTIREGHELKTDGPYRFLRHPSYGASYLTFIGLGFALNNWISMLVIAIPVLLGFRLRINVEEKVLEEQFGQSYRDYKAKTHAMIPWVY